MIARRRMLAAGPAVLLAGAANARVVIDVSAAPPGPLPAEFVSARTGRGAPAEWRVQLDPSVPGGRVIAQTAADPVDYRYPLAISQAVRAANVAVSVRFLAVSGQVDRAGGLAVRLIDANNYYVVRANALEDNVNFYRVINGSRHEIKGATAKVPSGIWHQLGLKADGGVFTISFNGGILFRATDRTLSAPGQVALWTKADSVTKFDALTIDVT